MVDTAQLVAEVKTKGVKKATAELDKFGKEAMDAEKSTDSMAKGATKAFNAVKVGSAAILGAATALTALSIKVASTQREWQTLSNIAGDSVDNFKATAFAAEQVGISAEKLADISKDTNEKLGEFIATGGGGFKDFFEQVAPQIGVTAEELQNLSGTQVLQRVTAAMEAANIPMEQQSFYLESIASDTTNLIPLLAKESEELNRLTDEYNSLNDALKITESDQKALSELSAQFDLLTSTGSNALSFLTAQFAPEIAEFVNFITANIPLATQDVYEFFDAFRDPENRASISGLNDEIGDLLAEISGIQQAINAGEFDNKTLLDGLIGYNFSGSTVEEAEAKIKSLREEVALLVAQKNKIESEQDTFGTNIQAPTPFQASGTTPRVSAKEEENKRILELEMQLAQQIEDARTAATERALNQQEIAAMQRMQGLQSAFGTISSLMAQENKELFRIGQAGALAQATINIAQGVTEALKLGPVVGPPLAAAVAAAGGAQIGTIIGQQPPSAGNFANGGIVGGSSFAGDNITANVNSGEMILNKGQQKNLFDIANGGNSSPKVTVINNAPNSVARSETLSSGEVKVIVEEVLNSEVLSPNSKFNKNLDKTRKVQRQF